MTTASQSKDRAAEARTSRTGAILSVATRTYRRHRLYRQTVTRLSSLADGELRNLGLSRDMIRSVARDTAKAA